jgi:hypothetical protein
MWQRGLAKSPVLSSGISLLALLLYPHMGRADQTGIPVVASALRIKQVRHAMPPGAKSRFYGVADFADKAKLLVHFYTHTAKTKGKQPVAFRTIDVFRQRGPRVEQLRHFREQGEDWLPNIYAKFLWVDPKTKRVPAFAIDTYSNDGFYGPTGDGTLLYFPKGWKSPAHTIGFARMGDHNESDSGDFDHLDENGFLVISMYHMTSTGYGAYTRTARWNGHDFILGPIPTPTPEPPAPTE